MRLVVSTVLAAVLVAGVAAPTLAQVTGQNVASRAYMVEPFAPPAPITIQGTGVRLRAEPFATQDTQVLSTGSTGLQLNVIGLARQPDWNWYQVILRNGQKAFIRSDLTSAPSRGGGAAPVAPRPVTTPVAPPQVAYTPPPTPQPWQPPAAQQAPQLAPVPQPAQQLPPIPTQPLNSGAISLTGNGNAPLSATPSPSPVDNGLLSVAPSAPTPHLSDPVNTSVAPALATPGDVASIIRAQLDAKRCWSDSSNMMDAQRLRASFGVTFAQNGRFASEPRLIEPASEPGNDPSMMVFLAKARAAMRTCNALGFDVPAEYFSGRQGEIRLDFSAR